MFEIAQFDPWRGPQYRQAPLKLLVLGESRYHKDFTDHQIIDSQRVPPGSRPNAFT
jgi:hypothetical protein